MKIFLLASSFPDKSNPMSGIFNFRFVKQMSELGEDVDVVFFRMWSPRRKIISSYFYDDIKVTQVCLPQIPFRTSATIKFNNFICRILGWFLLRENLKSSDIIHSVSLSTSGNIAEYWAKKLCIPHVGQAIGSDVNSDIILMGKKYFDWIKNIDGIITNSYDLQKSLQTYFPEKAAIETIYRGIQVNELEANGNKVIKGTAFLYLGGLGNKTLPCGINTKGGITLMEAWGQAEKELQSLDATLYFGGPDSDDEIFDEWKKNLKFPEKIQLIGKLDPSGVKNYLRKADVVVIPSMQEGLPNVLTESCASGKPAIGSTAGGISEVIVDGETGYIFEKGNAEQLKELLIRSANNPEQNKIMGRKAYERVKASFNSDSYSQKILSFYKKIINSKKMNKEE
ncbi:MAG: glycosyltransferase family 4 protein [Ginsengibacter sp.]